MRITGSTDGEYLQLFKTKYALQDGDKLTIRYKVLSGNSGMAWALSAEGAETTAVSSSIKSASSSPSVGEWVEHTITFGSGFGQVGLSGKTLAMMALRFTEAEDLDVLIGEVSLTRKDAVTPEAPVLRTDVKGKDAEGHVYTYEAGAAIWDYTYEGATVKLVWSMGEAPEDKPWETVRNSDVNAWYYKVYVQQEEGDPVMCTATTSWAAYVVNAPVDVSASTARRSLRSLGATTWSCPSRQQLKVLR